MLKQLIVLMLVAAATAAWRPSRASAGVTEDLEWVRSEMTAPSAQWDRPALEELLANMLREPQGLSAWEFLQARTLAGRVALDASGLNDAEKRLALNDLRVRALADSAEIFLTGELTDARDRLDVFAAQLRAAREITNHRQQREVCERLGRRLAADIKTYVMDNESLTPPVKEALLVRAVQTAETIPTGLTQRSLLTALYDYAGALDTPGASEARLAQAKLLMQTGNRDQALQRLEENLKDPRAAQTVQLESLRLRLGLLTGGTFAPDSAADIEAMAVSPLPGDASAIGPAVAARREACRMLLASDRWTLPQYRLAAEAIVADLIEQGDVDILLRTDLVTDVLTDLSSEAALHRANSAALGYARAAYVVCPVERLGPVVDRICVLLASASSDAVREQGAASEFLARQRGSFDLPGYHRALTADFSNEAIFPRVLSRVALPYDSQTILHLEQSAAQAAPLTRGAVEALLNRPEEALASAATAIGSKDLRTVVVMSGRFVRALHESAAAERGFRLHHVFGPAGRDGQMGTADDTPNVAMKVFDAFPGPLKGGLDIPDVPLKTTAATSLPADPGQRHYYHALAELVRRGKWNAFSNRLAELGVDTRSLAKALTRAPRAKTNFGSGCGGVLFATESQAAIAPRLDQLDYVGFNRPVVLFDRLPASWPTICEATFTALSDRTAAAIVGPDVEALSLRETLRLAAWAQACRRRCHSIVVNYTAAAGAEPSGQSQVREDRIVVALALVRLGAPDVPVWVVVDPGGSARWFKRITAWDRNLYSGIALTGPALANACRTREDARRVYLHIGKQVAPAPTGIIGLSVPALNERVRAGDDSALVQYQKLRGMLGDAGFRFIHIQER